jgi:NAD+ synthase (glutamine-hydrolysing)
MKIYLGQIDTTVGDFEGNLSLILKHLERAGKESADLAVFPELCITGYPPKDLVNYESFNKKSGEYLAALASKIGDTAALVGCIEYSNDKPEGLNIYNSAALVHKGRVIFRHRKNLLPTYDVFDEARYFEPGDGADVFEFKGKRFAISICEDIWNDRDFWKKQRYESDPIEAMMKQGADIIVNISASPFTLGKIKLRHDLLQATAKKYKVPALMVNSIGGNDELIFDGTSMVFDGNGSLSCLLKSFAEDHTVIDTESLQQKADYTRIEMPDAVQAHDALVLGVRDYFNKCGFTKAVLGLSGGIDSAVTACIGAEALGSENVLAVIMPSRYSAPESVRDAEAIAKNLGIETRLMSIEGPFEAYQNLFKDEFKGLKPDITEENFQARIRGNILMGFANKYGHLLLTTGNKSELAVGYCTLYGDMSGGLAVLSDVPKTLVYEIASLINKDREIIPSNTITRPPSAELRPDQTDQDTLPPYDRLDKIIHLYVECEKDLDEIAAIGFDRELTAKVIRMIDGAEYKRRQMPVGLKVTSRAFGFGRRMPVAQRYHRNKH